jgi:hypothetical protein
MGCCATRTCAGTFCESARLVNARARWWILAGACAAAFSCARVAPPPGGPEDRDSPRILALVPAPDSSGVAPSSPILIVFSEGMDERSVMKGLRIIPQQDIRPEWAEDTLRIVPDKDWPSDRPTILWTSDTARDARGNPLERPIILRFSTRPDSAGGTITGRVYPGKESKSAGRFLILPFPAAAFDSTSASEGDPLAIVEAEKDGAYRITKLAPGSYRVVGIFDRDGDARTGESGEAWGVTPDAVTVGAGETVAPEFIVGTLDSLGTIHAEVLADSGSVVMEASEDSTQFVPAWKSVRDASGPISVKVPTGRDYFVRAFVDANRDSTWAADEKVQLHPELVSLRLTSEKTGLRFDLRAAAGVKP